MRDSFFWKERAQRNSPPFREKGTYFGLEFVIGEGFELDKSFFNMRFSLNSGYCSCKRENTKSQGTLKHIPWRVSSCLAKLQWTLSHRLLQNLEANRAAIKLSSNQQPSCCQVTMVRWCRHTWPSYFICCSYAHTFQDCVSDFTLQYSLFLLYK